MNANLQARERLSYINEAMVNQGYDGIMQIVGYLLTEDPIYITNANGARRLIQTMDRDDLLKEIVAAYLAG